MNRRNFLRKTVRAAMGVAVVPVGTLLSMPAKSVEADVEKCSPCCTPVNANSFNRHHFDSDASFHLRRAAHEAFEKAGYIHVETGAEERDYGNEIFIYASGVNPNGEQIRAFHRVTPREVRRSKDLMAMCAELNAHFYEIALAHLQVCP